MKKNPLLFVLIMLVFTILINLSCKKDRVHDNILAGKWELRKSEGGFAGTVNYPAGNGVIIQYNENGTVKFYTHFTPYDSGTYKYWWSITDNMYNVKVVTGNNQDYTQKFLVEQGQLVFHSKMVCCDIPYLAAYDRVP